MLHALRHLGTRLPRRRLLAAGLLGCLLYGPAWALASEPAGPGPHVALLLPTSSPDFAEAAGFVRDGFVAAHRSGLQTGLPVLLYPMADEAAEVVATYERAVADGARLVVGPLTRRAVATLAVSPSLPVTTLALNAPQDPRRLPDNLYTFSLQVETEARQAARMAFEEGRRSALTLGTDTPLSRRMVAAFVEEFVRLGARQQARFDFSVQPADLLAMRDAVSTGEIDTVFLAVDAGRARVAMSYIGDRVPAFATSRIQDGRPPEPGEATLDGVRFVGMPWLLQPDHAAVMVYPRPREAAGPDFERLYALGIDAWRLAAGLLRGWTSGESLDGVTGRISLSHGRAFERELVPARFEDGRAVPLPPGR